jgi:hypothetical protein
MCVLSNERVHAGKYVCPDDVYMCQDPGLLMCVGELNDCSGRGDCFKGSTWAGVALTAPCQSVGLAPSALMCAPHSLPALTLCSEHVPCAAVASSYRLREKQHPVQDKACLRVVNAYDVAPCAMHAGERVSTVRVLWSAGVWHMVLW